MPPARSRESAARARGHGTPEAPPRRARRDLRARARHPSRGVLRGRRGGGWTRRRPPLHEHPGPAPRRRPAGVSTRRPHGVHARAEGAARGPARGRAAGRPSRRLLPLAHPRRRLLLGRGPRAGPLRRRAGLSRRHVSRRVGCPHLRRGPRFPLVRELVATGGPPVVASIAGSSVEEYVFLARAFAEAGAAWVEANLADPWVTATVAPFEEPGALRELATRTASAVPVPVAARIPERMPLPYARLGEVLRDAGVRV